MNEHQALSGGYQLRVLVGCRSGPCPKVGLREARPGFRVVQGARIPESERAVLGHIPDQEDVVEVPEEILLDYARRLRDEGRL